MKLTDLAKHLNINAADLLVTASQMNVKYDLGIDDLTDLTQVQYNIIRSSLDTDFMVQLMRGDKTDRKYNYTKSPAYLDLLTYLSDNDVNGCSTEDVSKRYNGPECGKQTVAAAMRASGYESKMVYLEGGGQGRRWFLPSFM